MSKVKEVFGTKAKTRKVKRKRNKNITYGQMVVDEHLVQPPSCQGEYRSSTQASSSHYTHNERYTVVLERVGTRVPPSESDQEQDRQAVCDAPQQQLQQSVIPPKHL